MTSTNFCETSLRFLERLKLIYDIFLWKGLLVLKVSGNQSLYFEMEDWLIDCMLFNVPLENFFSHNIQHYIHISKETEWCVFYFEKERAIERERWATQREREKVSREFLWRHHHLPVERCKLYSILGIYGPFKSSDGSFSCQHLLRHGASVYTV